VGEEQFAGSGCVKRKTKTRFDSKTKGMKPLHQLENDPLLLKQGSTKNTLLGLITEGAHVRKRRFHKRRNSGHRGGHAKKLRTKEIVGRILSFLHIVSPLESS
jgi:hypothetical protein